MLDVYTVAFWTLEGEIATTKALVMCLIAFAGGGLFGGVIGYLVGWGQKKASRSFPS